MRAARIARVSLAAVHHRRVAVDPHQERRQGESAAESSAPEAGGDCSWRWSVLSLCEVT